jgi:preprotein translocase subunit SecA
MLFFKIFGDPNEKYLKKIKPLVEKINSLEKEFEKIPLEDFPKKTEEFRERLNKGETLDNLLPEVFALVREAAKRTLGQRHFDCQLLGGIVLHQGKIAEMKTGEGKTLVATLPASLNALEKKGVHIITVNDYLAKRDTVWMGQIYHALGLSVGCIVQEAAFIYDPEYQKEVKSEKLKVKIETGKLKVEGEEEERDKERDLLGSFKIIESYLRPVPRREAYLADITYGTNNEFGFDYLRDNLAYSLKDQVQREHNFAILDEIDSILIDEARTPLIISSPAQETEDIYYFFAKIGEELKRDLDYQIDEKDKTFQWREEGQEKVINILKRDPWQEGDFKTIHKLENAIKAKEFFILDRDYIIKNGEIIIVDEFTGRLMPSRRWSAGIHQAVEAKEHIRGHKEVKVKTESITLATITFQNYFRLYKKLAGMTGTALTSAEEFDKVYGLQTIVIPTNKPMIRVDLPDKVFKTEKGKFKAIVEEVKKRHQKLQPILIGTTSIEKNELLSKMLMLEGIPCQVLNAKNHEKEAQIIAQAGKLGQVTVATNMAGRGVDIILGGNPPDPEEAKKVKELGGLHVIGTERHESRRIDNQLRGRAGRQGDPGSSQFFISLEDDLLRIFGGEKIQRLMQALNIPETEAIESKFLSNIIEAAQTRVENYNFEIRKRLLEYDNVLEKQRSKIYRQRQEILSSDLERLKKEILEKIKKEIKNIIELNYNQKQQELDFKNIEEEVKTIFPLKENLVSFFEKEKENVEEKKEKLLEYLFNLAKKELLEKEEKEGKENFENLLRFVFLKTIDTFWAEHLETLEDLQFASSLKSYGGRDPLVEYKSESYKFFEKLQETIDFYIVRTIFKLTIQKNE